MGIKYCLKNKAIEDLNAIQSKVDNLIGNTLTESIEREKQKYERFINPTA
jgi:hypothetical protein